MKNRRPLEWSRGPRPRPGVPANTVALSRKPRRGLLLRYASVALPGQTFILPIITVRWRAGFVRTRATLANTMVPALTSRALLAKRQMNATGLGVPARAPAARPEKCGRSPADLIRRAFQKKLVWLPKPSDFPDPAAHTNARFYSNILKNVGIKPSQRARLFVGFSKAIAKLAAPARRSVPAEVDTTSHQQESFLQRDKILRRFRPPSRRPRRDLLRARLAFRL